MKCEFSATAKKTASGLYLDVITNYQREWNGVYYGDIKHERAVLRKSIYALNQLAANLNSGKIAINGAFLANLEDFTMMMHNTNLDLREQIKTEDIVEDSY